VNPAGGLTRGAAIRRHRERNAASRRALQRLTLFCGQHHMNILFTVGLLAVGRLPDIENAHPITSAWMQR
jgi:hypothetical protein